MLSNILGTSDSSTTPFEVVEGEGGSTHNLDSVGGSGDLIFDAQATASASYGSLRASASGSITNSFFDPNYDFDAGTGVPIAFYSQGSARFSQTLQYGGTAVNYTSTYILRLTGSIIGGARAAVIIDLTHGSEPAQSWTYDAVGDYDLALFSQAYIHGGAPQEFQLSINTLYSFDTDTLAPGGDFTGSADFGNTLEVVGIDLRDELGKLQELGTITSDSGQVFTITGVPEPSSAILILMACGVASTWRYRLNQTGRIAA
ncbi:MAG: hypothetical protein H7Y36_12490 [Armatimonadetes bacterium]|nr:hypothetical protein [Akkermansiaceae bacterium]